MAGNIIVRQRGSTFHPGQHVASGRDHTLYALVPGFVQFYSANRAGQEKKFVGITTNQREETLPRDVENEGRSRYFGGIELSRERGDWEHRPGEGVRVGAGVGAGVGEDELMSMIRDAMEKARLQVDAPASTDKVL